MFTLNNFHVVMFSVLLSIIFSLNSNLCEGLTCVPTVLFKCPENEMCMEESNLCECLAGYVREYGICVFIEGTLPPLITPDLFFPTRETMPTSKPNDTSYSKVWFILPFISIMVISCLVYLGRRYMWLERLVQLRGRRYDTVLVERQGDDDDPPIP